MSADLSATPRATAATQTKPAHRSVSQHQSSSPLASLRRRSARLARLLHVALLALAVLTVLLLASRVGETHRLQKLLTPRNPRVRTHTQLRYAGARVDASNSDSGGSGEYDQQQQRLPSLALDGLDAIDHDRCSPKALDTREMAFHSTSAQFYTELQRVASTLPTPEFAREHALLCSESRAQWTGCLPLSGRRDEPFCVRASRDDLLVPQLSRTQICYASVLHMILVEVYEELAAAGASPVLLYGTLLGAVRNASIIPYTEDADLGFQDPSATARASDAAVARSTATSPTPSPLTATISGTVVAALRRRGYHLFRHGIFRVCVAANHPLAARLYNLQQPLGVEYGVPYVDLYRMTQHTVTHMWDIEEIKLRRKVPDSRVRPFARVALLGRDFDTLADPVAFLQREYGHESYLSPENWSWAW